MTSATAPRDIKDEVAAKRFKMALLQDNYMADGTNRGRFPKGAVLLVDEETAIRWYTNGVAEPADPDATTYGEIRQESKRAEFLRRAQPAEGVFDRAVTRQSFTGERQLMPPPMPVPPRRARPPRRSELEGAEIVSDPTEDDD